MTTPNADYVRVQRESLMSALSLFNAHDAAEMADECIEALAECGHWEYRAVGGPAAHLACGRASAIDPRESLLWEGVRAEYADMQVHRRWVTEWEPAPAHIDGSGAPRV